MMHNAEDFVGIMHAATMRHFTNMQMIDHIRDATKYDNEVLRAHHLEHLIVMRDLSKEMVMLILDNDENNLEQLKALQTRMDSLVYNQTFIDIGTKLKE
jgi:hypothetical protein